MTIRMIGYLKEMDWFPHMLKRLFSRSKRVLNQVGIMSLISAKKSDKNRTFSEKEKEVLPFDAKCLAAFVAEMNRYATMLGMSNTNFVNPSGMDENNHYSCAKDMARMTMCCTSYRKLMDYWGQTTYSVPVGGPNARTISGSSSYTGKAMSTVEDYYHIIGGKSGTWVVSSYNHIENLCLVCKSKVDNEWLVGCILYNTYNSTAGVSSNRGVPFKEMLDWLEEHRQTPSIPAQPVQAIYCSAWVMPSLADTAYQDIDYEMVGKSSTTRAKPCSTTKLMTAMVALDNIGTDEIITIKSSDIRSGSGDTFYADDTLLLGDAILAMLLASSNTLATAIARTAGERILGMK